MVGSRLFATISVAIAALLRPADGALRGADIAPTVSSDADLDLEHSLAHGVDISVSEDGLLATVRFVDAATGEQHEFTDLRREDRAFSAAQSVVIGNVPHASRRRLIREIESARGSATYTRRLADGWIVATRMSTTRAHVTRQLGDGAVVQIQPMAHMRSILSDADHRRLHALASDAGAAEHEPHVLSRRRALGAFGGGALCGARRMTAAGHAILDEGKEVLESNAAPLQPVNASTLAAAMLHSHTMDHSGGGPQTFASNSSAPEGGARSLQFSNELFLNPADLWSDCFPGQRDVHFLETGLVVDLGFFQSYDSDVFQTLRALEAIVSTANMVFHFQLNIQVRVRQLLLVLGDLTSGPLNSSYVDYFESSPNFVSGGRTCTPSSSCVCELGGGNAESCAPSGGLGGEPFCGMAQPLQAMTEFSRSLSGRAPASLAPVDNTYLFDEALPQDELKSLAHWHLFTDCFPPPGIVGLAWGLEPGPGQPRRGTMCDVNGLNTAVSTRSTLTWETFAHEAGHNFGATHTFQEGQGQTGGIMDYGKSEVGGKIQFNEKYTRGEICGELTLMKNDNLCGRSGGANLFPSDDGRCRVDPTNSLSWFCSGGFCPITSDNQIGACTPFPASLVMGDEAFDFKASVLGKQLSGYGGLIRFDWRLAGGDACSPFPPGTFSAFDMVLVSRGGCPFDVKAQTLDDAGAGAMVVHDDREADELVAMFGDLTGVLLRTAFVSQADGLVMTARIAEAAANGATVPGYLGAAPPDVISRYLEARRRPPEDETGFPLFVIGVAFGVIAVIIGAALVSRAHGRRHARTNSFASFATLRRSLRSLRAGFRTSFRMSSIYGSSAARSRADTSAVSSFASAFDDDDSSGPPGSPMQRSDSAGSGMAPPFMPNTMMRTRSQLFFGGRPARAESRPSFVETSLDGSGAAVAPPPGLMRAASQPDMLPRNGSVVGGGAGRNQLVQEVVVAQQGLPRSNSDTDFTRRRSRWPRFSRRANRSPAPRAAAAPARGDANRPGRADSDSSVRHWSVLPPPERPPHRS